MSNQISISVIVLYALCIKSLSCVNVTRQSTELYDAFNRFLKFSPMMLGYNFTEHDEALFATARKKQDVHLSVEKMLIKYGYPVERYEVITEDGYILVLIRIRGSGHPVFLMHGLMMSADEWVTPGPEYGLAFMLADEGYDVWMGNARGSKHSCRHLSLSPESPAFWDFSWDEIGRYDLPAMIDFVLLCTNSRRLVYIGHSQGTTAFFVMTSEKPEYNHKVALMVALAPATDIANLKSPLLQFLNYLTLLHTNQLFALLRRSGINSLGQNIPILKPVSSTVCGRSEIAIALCNRSVFLMAGFTYSQLNLQRLPVILSHLTSEVSVKQLEHYAQTITFRRFQRFDHGARRNKVLFGMEIPPKYNLSSITTPMAFFYSSDDWLASDVDVQIIRKKLQNVKLYKIPAQFTHLDFVIAKDLRKLIFKPLLKVLINSKL